MTRLHSRQVLGGVARCSLAAVLAGQLACIADSPGAPDGDRNGLAGTARLSLSAQISSTSGASATSAEDRTVEVRAFYRRSPVDGGAAQERTLPSSPQSFVVVVGTTHREEIVVQVGDCL